MCPATDKTELLILQNPVTKKILLLAHFTYKETESLTQVTQLGGDSDRTHVFTQATGPPLLPCSSQQPPGGELPPCPF